MAAPQPHYADQVKQDATLGSLTGKVFIIGGSKEQVADGSSCGSSDHEFRQAENIKESAERAKQMA